MEEFDTPHLRSPFRIAGATAMYVEQGSIEEIIQNCVAILRTPYGSREDMQDFGLIQQEFEDVKDITTHDIEAALMRDEPRARALTSEQLKSLAREVQVQLQTTAQEMANG
jgi:phage baseplate assembly protein W